jgi:hypothetical protein
VVRGSEDNKMILRASFLPDAGAELQYGGEVADNMLMNLYAIAEKKNAAAKPEPEPCRGRCCAYPDRSGVQDYFRVPDCSRIDWSLYDDDFIPYPRDEAHVPHAAVAATGHPCHAVVSTVHPRLLRALCRYLSRTPTQSPSH